MNDHYSCFFCADNNKDELRKLNDVCPTCGRNYGFPLDNYPAKIGNYEVIKSLSRGYYSAAYKVKHPSFQNRALVLKIIPKLMYKNHNKNIQEECQLHSDIASNSHHIVQIFNVTEAKVNFGDVEIDSHVEELEFVDGFPLDKVLDGEINLTATECTQVALDLFRILFDLKQSHFRHNDLHGGNVIVQRLSEAQSRLDAIDPRIRVKAIDINSAGVGEKEYLPDRPRDIQRVARLVRRISEKLLTNPDSLNDLHYRALLKLVDVSYALDTTFKDMRSPGLEEIIKIIKNEYLESQYPRSNPWQRKLKLAHVNDFYNAQAMEPWFASQLFVDPENKWLTAVNSPGPQLITGMRGCGKTILLKSLQFHARASYTADSNNAETIRRLKEDSYVGLYVSSSRLIDITGNDNHADAFSILFIGYVKSALQAIAHLAELDQNLVAKSYHERFVNLLTELLPNSSPIKKLAISPTFLNFELEKMQYSLYRGEQTYRIAIKPAMAFEGLAKVIQQSATIWYDHHILFLLDDVSTRYVDVNRIRELISQLLIQNPNFSFKFTSEEHTIRYLLHSPGNIELARSGRDYQLFDFGKEVRNKIHGQHSKGRKKFVEDILKKRFIFNDKYANDKNFLPRNLLGDAPLEELARAVGESSSTSTKRKRLYSGFSVLIGMCVGDIGDILNLYEKFLQLSEKGKSLTETAQHKIYLDFSSLRLYDLKRLKSDMEKYVMGFAAASHRLLVQSVKNDPSGRVRQYNSIYVRITSKNPDEQDAMLEKINRMVDAGIFVSSGLAFRTKTRDTNPLLQFSLVFRKLFGLSHYIGLGERDRFELSGVELKNWLDHPEDTERILLESEVSEEPESEEPFDEEETTSEENNKIQEKVAQQKLFSHELDLSNIGLHTLPINKSEQLQQYFPRISIFSKLNQIKKAEIDNLVIGLGFEERAFESLSRYSKFISPKSIFAYEYPAKKSSPAILQLLKQNYPNAKIYIETYTNLGMDFTAEKGNSLIDVSGLSKAIIFNVIRQRALDQNEIYIAHTESQSYYPTDQEMTDVLKAYKENAPTDFLNSLDDLLGGEQGPYSSVNLSKSECDEARNRVLIAFAKPKNERLYHILDNREFDKIELVTPKSDSSKRSKVAAIVADIVGRKFTNTFITDFSANDLKGMINFIATKYHENYVDSNSNIEIALTGSKRQTIAIALLSIVCKFSKVWYIKPEGIDESRFSTGVGETNFVKIEMKK
jgi:hypothetical protein